MQNRATDDPEAKLNFVVGVLKTPDKHSHFGDLRNPEIKTQINFNPSLLTCT